MSKKYLIDDFEEFKGSYIFDKQDAKEVEVLDIDEQLEVVEDDYLTSHLNLPNYLKANKYLIVKIIE